MKFVDINKIIVPRSFKESNPSEHKILRKRKYYYYHGEFDNLIKVEEVKFWFWKKYILWDGYISYLIAKENNIKRISVVCI
ncbi:MAG: hypothetical protein FWG36_02910 [Oscillospiraceae bacterium]|nr:hypothetical protein [Oscillospiraceae bacterium]